MPKSTAPVNWVPGMGNRPAPSSEDQDHVRGSHSAMSATAAHEGSVGTWCSGTRMGAVESSFDRREIYFRNKFYNPAPDSAKKKKKKRLPMLVVTMTRKVCLLW